MLVRGAGEGFNLIIPVRRMVKYCEENKIMWAINKNVKMPTDDELKEMPVENTPKEKKDDESERTGRGEAEKMFPFMLRIIYPKLLIIKE